MHFSLLIGDYRCLAANDAGSADMVVTINVHNSYINSASLGTSGTSGVIAGVITALLIFVVLAGVALFYVMNKVRLSISELPRIPPQLSVLEGALSAFVLFIFILPTN